MERCAALGDYVAAFELAVERVAGELSCSIEQAVDLLLDLADADGKSLGDVAVAVVEGRIRVGE